MTGTGRIIGSTLLLLISLGASLTLLPDIYLQMFAMWVALEVLLRRWFYDLRPNSLKTFTIAAMLVLLTRSATQALYLSAGDMEHFIVDWGLDGAPKACGGMMDDPDVVPPTHTATCDIWSDPEKIVDQRIERVLNETKNSVREMEKWLDVDTPDERSTTDSDAVVV